MTRHVLFLHSSNDREPLQDLVRIASASREVLGCKIWIDAPQYAQNVSTLGAQASVDAQIADAISHAFAIVYFVGRTGAGPYQEAKELPWVHEALKARSATDDPLRLVPVLLRDGNLRDIPAWATQYVVVNRTRDLSPARIWDEIELRLRQPAQPLDPDYAPEVRPSETEQWVSDIVSALGHRTNSNLTVFIGPYAPPGSAEIGPAAMTEQLLKLVQIRADDLRPLLPWPSEAGEWIKLCQRRSAVEGFFLGHQMTALGRTPPDLAVRTAELAQRWTSQRGRQRKDWNGLLLLTTRVDLALEAALLKAPSGGVGFTRFIPTAMKATRQADKKCMLQKWSPGGAPYVADPTAVNGPWANIEEALSNPSQVTLESADSVILVKLCGSIDVAPSLVVTVSDFFEAAKHLGALPQVMRESIQASPQLLIGRGFASPLAQMVRLHVLQNRPQHLPRVLVMPRSDPARATAAPPNDAADSLCDLELRLLDDERSSDVFREALELTSVHRTDPNDFLVQLAGAL